MARTLSGPLNIDTTSAATGANTTETDLWTYTMPGGTLGTDGDAVRVTAWGTTGANTNNKTIRLKFGATTVLDSGAMVWNGKAWHVTAVVARTGGSAEEAIGQIVASPGGASIVAVATTHSTPGENLSFNVTGQNGTAAANDIVFEGAVVELLQKALSGLQVNDSVASQATSLLVTPAAAGSGLGLSTASSGTNEALTVDAKGTGTVTVGGTSTGDVVIATGGGKVRTGTGLLQLGGTSSSFPALKRSSTELQVRLADDSAAAAINVDKVTAQSTAADALKTSGGITAGSGNVAIVGTDGRVPAISSTYFAALSGANLTSLNGSAVASGTVPAAQLGSGSGGSTKFLREDSTWQTVPAVPVVVLAKSTNYTVSTGDGIDVLVTMDASGGARTVSLYTASGNTGRTIRVKKIDSNANAVTIAANGAETIDGYSTLALYVQHDFADLISDGTNWVIVSERVTILMKAYLSANQTGVTTGVETLVALNAKEVDTATAFDTTTHLFTPPRAGRYRVTASIRVNSPGTGAVLSAIKANANAQSEHYFGSAPNATLDLPVGWLSTNVLSSSDTIGLYGTHNKGSNGQFDNGAAHTFLEVEYLGH